MKKFLIIGSSGFIGSHIIKYLEGNKIGCDISKASNHPESIIIESFSDIQQIIKSLNFDYIVNCSGAADVSLSIKDPAKDFELNTFNVMKLYDYVKDLSPNTKIINLSSAAIYGNPISLPVLEDSKKAPLSPYGHHKLMAETIATEFHDIFSVRSVNLRIFSCFGSGLRKQIF